MFKTTWYIVTAMNSNHAFYFHTTFWKYEIMFNFLSFKDTRPKPVGYVFSMAVGIIGEWLRLVPFLLGDEQVILRGGGAGSF